MVLHTNCATGVTLSPGATCSVVVGFAPTVPGQTSGGLWLRNTTGTSDPLLVFYGRGVDAEAGTASLSFAPSALNFGAQAVGTLSAAVTLTLVNNGPAKLIPSAFVINGPAAYDYSAAGTCGVGVAIPAGGSCTLSFFFLPAALGNRPANLVVDAPQLANLAILSINVTGATFSQPGDSADADVVEFSWSLDNDAPGTLPVCRFTGTGNIGPNSHFFTSDANECAIVKTNPFWQYEGLAFRTLPPTAGACAPNMIPVIRFYWAGADVTLLRHRYVVDPTEGERMRAAGWLEEGVVFCAPP